MNGLLLNTCFKIQISILYFTMDKAVESLRKEKKRKIKIRVLIFNSLVISHLILYSIKIR